MHVLIAHHTKIPVNTYGGTERIMWWLGKRLVQSGHEVTYLVDRGSSCPFASVVEIRTGEKISSQIPPDTDLVHFFFQHRERLDVPYLITNQGNVPDEEKDLPLDINTVFVSQNHASRHGATCYVHNGIDIEDYGEPNYKINRSHLHFLAKTSWRAKNVEGALRIAELAGYPLDIMGGTRINSKISLKRRLSNHATFHGMIGGEKKLRLLNRSRGLIFPVRWHEPFGIAIIESLYFGCPVFGTTYGSLPELVPDQVGYLSNSYQELAHAIRENEYLPAKCHEHVLNHFTSQRMTTEYIRLYTKVLSGQQLNQTPPDASKTKHEIFTIVQ